MRTGWTVAALAALVLSTGCSVAVVGEGDDVEAVDADAGATLPAGLVGPGLRGHDGGAEGAPDAGLEAGLDAGAPDAGFVDAGLDAGPDPEVAILEALSVGGIAASVRTDLDDEHVDGDVWVQYGEQWRQNAPCRGNSADQHPWPESVLDANPNASCSSPTLDQRGLSPERVAALGIDRGEWLVVVTVYSHAAVWTGATFTLSVACGGRLVGTWSHAFDAGPTGQFQLWDVARVNAADCTVTTVDRFADDGLHYVYEPEGE